MTFSLKLVAAAVALSVVPQIASAFDGVKYSEKVEYYDISGNTLDAVWDSILANRPDELGEFIALAAFTYTWRYNYGSLDDAACTVSTPSVEINIVVTLPRLLETKKVPREIREFWANFYPALEEHEYNHVEDFRRVGELIPSALSEVTTPDCDTIEAAANAVGDEFVAIAQRLADEYDERTEHGVSEGAVFP